MSDRAQDHHLDLLDGLIYADVFDCALTVDEMCRWSRVRVAPHALRRRLREDAALRSLVGERDGLLFLRDRADLAGRRSARSERAHRIKRHAATVARFVRHVPFVRGLQLTGSVAADDAGAEADLDVLVIVAPRRIGLVFLMLGSVARVTRRRVFCPNLYLAQDHLALEPGSIYLAREIAQALPLLGDARALRAANPWVEQVFPNADSAATASVRSAGGLLQRLLEAPLRGGLGDRLERSAIRVGGSRLEAHYGRFGESPPPDGARALAAGAALRFHGGAVAESVLARYERRRAELASQLGAVEAFGATA